MSDRSRYGNSSAFLDLLFNFLLGFILLFILLLMIIKIEASKPSVEDKNEYVITLDWNEATDDDVDLWILGPTGTAVGYRNKDGDGMFLQRDDLGNIPDKFMDPSGNTVQPPLNQEIVNIRKIVPGKYVVNAHMYRKQNKETTAPVLLRLKLYQINPYKEAASVQEILLIQGEEKTLLVFTVNADGSVFINPTLPIPFIVRKMSENSLGMHP